jgi:hypothetical protein
MSSRSCGTCRRAPLRGRNPVTEPPYQPAELPSHVAEARKKSELEEAALLERLEPKLHAALQTARDALDQLGRSHALVADRSDISLSADTGSRAQALWECSAAAIGLGRAFIDLVALGYHSQTIPTYRAIFELLGLIGVLGDVHEDDFLADWLANGEVKQRKVRQAAKRESDRVREQLKSDGYTDLVRDAAELMNILYRPLSDSSHGRREAVRAYISEPLRQAATGAHPSAQERLITAEGSLLLIEDLVQVVGGALAFLYGGTFFRDHVVPLHETVASAMETLQTTRGTLERKRR